MQWFKTSRRILGLVSVVISGLGLFVGNAPSARAAVVTVTTTSDSGVGSLRDAIISAEASAPPVTIQFAIPPFDTTVKTITLTSPLPTITVPVVIDGYTQSNSTPNTLSNADNAVILIELNGNGNQGAGIEFVAGSSTVRGLVINRFAGSAVSCVATGSDLIEGNFIGTDPTGTTALGNNVGISIGGGATNSVIGGTTPDARNIISGNVLGQIDITERNTLVEGNFVGVDTTGTNALGASDGDGIDISSDGNIIGGTNSGARNVVSGNFGDEIVIGGTSNIVQGNFIGTDVRGTVGFSANGSGGVLVDGGDHNIIGGTSAGAGNVVSGNGGSGISLFANNVTIQGNLIGLDVTGTKTVTNRGDGVSINSSFGGPPEGQTNIVGGTAAGAPNVISGNANGISLNLGTGLNVVQGNLIGTDITGTQLLSNSLSGILIDDSASNLVGGATVAAANLIVGSGSNGVTIVGTNATRDAILGNSISSNGQLGIDLGGDGVTADHTFGNFPPGPNGFENFPVLTSAVCSNGGTRVQGTIVNSVGSSTAHLEFFANLACDPAGFGEGEMFLGSTNVTVDVNGAGSFDISFTNTDLMNEFITATTTDNGSNTSEFAQCIQVVDNQAPTITQCATGIVVSASSTCQATVPDFASQVQATDNCTPANALVITQSPTNGTVVGLGSTTVTITVADTVGNSTNCTASFTVVDTTAPTISCPSNISTAVPPPEVSAVVTFATPTATDACSTPIITVNPPSGSTFTSGTTTVLCTAVDGSGNSNTCTFTVTVSTIVTQQVIVDIGPKHCPNILNIKAGGVLQVAIVGTGSVNVNQINPASVTLNGVPSTTNTVFQDVAVPFDFTRSCPKKKLDGVTDLVLTFNMDDLVASLGTVKNHQIRVLTVAGSFTNGLPFLGRDRVKISTTKCALPNGLQNPF